MSIFEHILSILLTSLLSSVFVFLSLRWVFSRLVSPLTHLGAKVAGEASGFSRASKAVTEDAAKGILDSPNIQGLKMIGRQFGFDIDGMVEEHGAVQTLAGITQILSMLGISPEMLLTQGLGNIAKGIIGKSSKGSGELGKIG